MESAVRALLALNGPSLRTGVREPGVVRLEVPPVELPRGGHIVGTPYERTITVDVRLDAAQRWYTLVTRVLERRGVSLSTSTFYGTSRRWQKSFVDVGHGRVDTGYDTGPLVDRIAGALQPLGWRPKPTWFARLFGRS